MEVKRLRKGKNINSETVADLSGRAGEQLYIAVRRQFIETMKLPAEYAEVSDGINSMGYMVLRTGHNLRDYYDVSAGKYVLENKRTDIAKALSYLCEKAKPFLARKELGIRFKTAEEKIFADIDREKLFYAILNIMLNSVQNTPGKGLIKISVSKTKKFVKISVSDNGLGMDEEVLEHCFEPFFTKVSGAGESRMGIGLTLANHFASESGGRLNAASEKGKGTTVNMFLPLSADEGKDLSVETPLLDILGGTFSPVNIMLSGIEE